jgi:predicted secreted hydrolase
LKSASRFSEAVLLAALILGELAACSAPSDGARGDRATASASRAAVDGRRVQESAQGPGPDASGFAVARGSRAWSFPRDHGVHPEYATEWWYTTGILRTAEGRRFGYELTFFRLGLVPGGSTVRLAAVTAGRLSPWRATDLILAHATLTDPETRRFLVDYRASRAAQGWAGADSTRLDVWVDDWRMTQARNPDSTQSLATSSVSQPGSGADFTVRVPEASTSGRFGLDLRLLTLRPPVLHGDGGLSPKDARAEPHASWYLSLPRLETKGTLSVEGEVFEVSGTTWMDHEFFTGGLSEAQVGWDWFSARLDDGRDLMLYRLRRKDGSTDYLAGTVVAADGSSWRPADTRDALFEPLASWTSPASGTAYPVGWRVRLPAEKLDLTVRTPLPGQEVRAGGTAVDYWEGLVDYRGMWGNAAIAGEGYLEMTGYEKPMEMR